MIPEGYSRSSLWRMVFVRRRHPHVIRRRSRNGSSAPSSRVTEFLFQLQNIHKQTHGCLCAWRLLCVGRFANCNKLRHFIFHIHSCSATESLERLLLDGIGFVALLYGCPAYTATNERRQLTLAILPRSTESGVSSDVVLERISFHPTSRKLWCYVRRAPYFFVGMIRP